MLQPSFGFGPAMGKDGEVTILNFQMYKSGNVTVYSITISTPVETWMVARRYREFLKCHRDLSAAGLRDIPAFPPKEPLLQQIFGNQSVRKEWAEERRQKLQDYLEALLHHPDTRRSPALSVLLVDGSRPPAAVAAHADGAADGPAESLRIPTILVNSVRARLTGDSGTVEVVIRLSTNGAGPFTVRIALLPLSDDGDLSSPIAKSIRGEATMWHRPDATRIEVPVTRTVLEGAEDVEARHRFTLEPGSLWQVEAVGVDSSGKEGNAASILLRAPTQEELDQLANVLVDRDSGERGPEDVADPAAEVAPDAEPPTTVAEAQAPESLAEVQESRSNPPEIFHFQSRGSSIISSEHSSDQDAQDFAGCEGHEGAKDPADQSNQAPRPRKRRGLQELQGPQHKAIAFRGLAGAEYMRRIEESNSKAVQQAPHKWEAEKDGHKRSVPVAKLDVVGLTSLSKEMEEEFRNHRSAEDLDDTRAEAQRRKDLEEEQTIASWIYAVTDNDDAGAAMDGEMSLQEALQTGEALCDLVRGIWPEHIDSQKISRGQAQQFRHRLGNIDMFLKACIQVGVPEHSRFVAADLLDGKNPRSLVRCLVALAGKAPELPHPNMEDANALRIRVVGNRALAKSSHVSSMTSSRTSTPGVTPRG